MSLWERIWKLVAMIVATLSGIAFIAFALVAASSASCQLIATLQFDRLKRGEPSLFCSWLTASRGWSSFDADLVFHLGGLVVGGALCALSALVIACAPRLLNEVRKV